MRLVSYNVKNMWKPQLQVYQAGREACFVVFKHKVWQKEKDDLYTEEVGKHHHRMGQKLPAGK